jgi:hypothetical protein
MTASIAEASAIDHRVLTEAIGALTLRAHLTRQG